MISKPRFTHLFSILLLIGATSASVAQEPLPFSVQLALFHSTETLSRINALGNQRKECEHSRTFLRPDATVSCQLPQIPAKDLEEVAKFSKKIAESTKKRSYVISLDLENDNILMGLGHYLGTQDNDLGKTHGMKVDVIKNNPDTSSWDVSAATTLYSRTLENDAAYWKLDSTGKAIYQDEKGAEFVEGPNNQGWVSLQSDPAHASSSSVPHGWPNRERRKKVGITYTEVNRFALDYTAPEKLGLVGYRLGGGIEFYNNTYSTTLGAQAQQRAWHGLFKGIDMVQYDYYRDPSKPKVTIVPFATASLLVKEDVLKGAVCSIHVGGEVGGKIASKWNASNLFVQANTDIEVHPLNLKIKALYRLYTRNARNATLEASYQAGEWGEFFSALNFLNNSENPDLQVYLEKPKLGIKTDAKERTMNLGIRVFLSSLLP